MPLLSTTSLPFNSESDELLPDGTKTPGPLARRLGTVEQPNHLRTRRQQHGRKIKNEATILPVIEVEEVEEEEECHGLKFSRGNAVDATAQRVAMD